MKRFLQMLFSNPLSIVQLCYYWLRIFILHMKKKKSVVFNFHHDYFVDIFYPIHKRIVANPGIEVFYSCDTKDETLVSALKAKNLEKRKISNKISPFVAFDLFICSEITGPDFPFKFFRTRKLETYHGNGISGFHKKIDVIKKFDAHFAIGPKFNEFLNSIYANEKKPNIYNVGYPKLDILLEKTEQTQELRKLYKLKKKPTILYAPHWNPYGSLHIFGTKIIEELVKYDINLLIKPHHYLYAKYPEGDWKNQLNKFAKKYEHVTLVTRPNTQELYPLADLMISDTGTSAPFEFCLLQKPLLVFANYTLFDENPEEDNSEEKAILEASICFENLEDFSQMMKAFLNRDETFINEINSQKKRQRNLIDSLLYNPGKASQYAEQAILEELNQ